MKLSDEDVQHQLSNVPDWKLDDKTIGRRYKFSSFPLSVQFVNQVADVAEEMNHHPFISIDYRTVTLRLTSWHAGGLTELDFVEAKRCDELYLRSYSVDPPKQEQG